jgi:putative colanic acid biosynthesis UDP-glucose lipid carrier transferase
MTVAASLLEARPFATSPSSRDAVSRALVWGEAQTDARALGNHIDLRGLFGGALGVADAALIVAAAVIAHLLRHGFVRVPLEIASTTGLAVVIAVNTLYLCGAYTTNVMDPLPRQVSRVARVWTCVFVGLVLLGYLTKTTESFSRVWAIAWYFGTLALLVCARSMAAAQVTRWQARGRFATTAAIVDLCGRADTVWRRLRCLAIEGVYLAGVFRPGGADDETDAIGELLALSRHFRIDDVLVIVSSDSEADLAGILRRLSTMPANIRLCPSMPDLLLSPAEEGGLVLDLPDVTVHRKPLSGWNSVLKRAEDLVFGGMILTILAPFMLLIALCVRIETPGPALFRQKRQGFNNNVFTVFKFRTMVHRKQPESDVPQATRNDPRVTRIGRFLRRTSLDELPQLLNVMRGEMSLVGPRPHAVVHNEFYSGLIDDYIGRHRVRPGITGWAQVNGLRGETDTLDKMQRRVHYDLAYIDGWSLLFDIRIIVLTAFTAWLDRHAY